MSLLTWIAIGFGVLVALLFLVTRISSVSRGLAPTRVSRRRARYSSRGRATSDEADVVGYETSTPSVRDPSALREGLLPAASVPARESFPSYPASRPTSPPSYPGTERISPTTGVIDPNVQFTVYRPSTIVPLRWYPLLAFAHLSKRRPDAPPDEPDPVKEVQRIATKLLSDQPASYEPAKLDKGFSVPQKGLLKFVPFIEGCEFNPPEQSIYWEKSVHKLEFEMKASASVDGKDVEGQMTVFLGKMILTEVPLRISVNSHFVNPETQPLLFVESTAEPYRQIFASYSHKDTEIVEDFENHIAALGDKYLRDVKTLRAGEVWSTELERMIRDANVFQLFWSSNSMPSKFVRQEWEYALGLNRPKFIRPVYWEEPLPETKPDLPPEALRRLHFYKFVRDAEEGRGGFQPPLRGPHGPGESPSSSNSGIESYEEEWTTIPPERPPELRKDKDWLRDDFESRFPSSPQQSQAQASVPEWRESSQPRAASPMPTAQRSAGGLTLVLASTAALLLIAGLAYLEYHQETPTPTPTATPAASPTATVRPTPSPKTSPKPSPTPAAKQFPRPSPNPTRRSSPKPSLTPSAKPSPKARRIGSPRAAPKPTPRPSPKRTATPISGSLLRP